MKILMTGATGLVGKEVGKLLSKQGHEIIVISRSKKKAFLELPFACTIVEGDLEKSKVISSELAGVDVVVHLAGENVSSGRWSEEIKQRIYQSRVVGTQNLIASLPSSVKHFISASAIGYYGASANQEFDEESNKGPGFLADVCEAWESEVNKFQGRVVIFRTGVVLSSQGGALEKMLFPFKAGVGGALSDGSQWMSWIHLKDLAKMFVRACVDAKMSGIFNAVAPESVTNKKFSKTLAQVLERPLFLPVPKFALQLMFGEMSQVVLASQKVSSKKILEMGFEFEYPHLEGALKDCLRDKQGAAEVFEAEQFLPLPVDRVFDFFAEANNLEKITPPLLNFNIEKVSTNVVSKGTLIDYTLKVHGLPMYWKTEIAVWRPPFEFVDNQLKGPYSLWHHTHSFEEVPGGTLMRDRVRFRLPVGYLGWIGGLWLVKQDVRKIFSYRRESIFEPLGLNKL